MEGYGVSHGLIYEGILEDNRGQTTKCEKQKFRKKKKKNLAKDQLVEKKTVKKREFLRYKIVLFREARNGSICTTSVVKQGQLMVPKTVIS